MSTDHAYLAYELRDGLLQDLVAVGLLIEGARRSLRGDEALESEEGRPGDGGGAEALLARAAATVEADLAALRSVIDRLRPAA